LADGLDEREAVPARGMTRRNVAVLSVLAVLTVLGPAVALAANPPPYANPGWPGIPLGLLYWGLPAVVVAACFGTFVGFVVGLSYRGRLTRDDRRALERRVAKTATLVVAVPLLSFVVAGAVGMMQVG